MPHRVPPPEDPSVPPPGRRHGAGSETVLPYLTRSIAAKPTAPPRDNYVDSEPAAAPGDLPASEDDD